MRAEMFNMTPEAILEFENQWPVMGGRKEAAILDTFHVSAVTYHQALARVVIDPEWLAREPMLVRRLQRARDRRLNARAEKKFELS